MPPFPSAAVSAPDGSPAGDQAMALTRAWVEHAVIGLNLCPFAKAVQTKGLIRYALTDATDAAGLYAALVAELEGLARADADRIETTLLVHPGVLQDFDDYNDFLDLADAAVAEAGLDGVIQVASFHPQYRFAGTDADDVTNATNRSPHPMLHLIREASIERAVAAFPAPESIFETNMATLRGLGAAGWAALQRRCLAAAGGAAPDDCR